MVGTLSFLPMLHAAEIDYKKDIQPIFNQRCVECHSEKMKKPKGGYVFDNPARIKTEIGPSFLIRPGDPGNSDLMSMVTRANKDHPMPPDKADALTAKEIKTLSTWIREGALMEPPAPGTAKPTPLRPTSPDLQDWTNQEGKVIRAAFVKMIGNKVTLRMSGREYILPLNSLSDESQKQAMKAAGEMALRPTSRRP